MFGVLWWWTTIQHFSTCLPQVLCNLTSLTWFCLHYVMLPRINRHLQLFKQAWDRHSLSTEQGRSPQQLWIAGQLMANNPISDPINEPVCLRIIFTWSNKFKECVYILPSTPAHTVCRCCYGAIMNLLHNLLTYFQQGGYVFVAVCLSFSPSTVFQETWWRGVVWTNA